MRRLAPLLPILVLALMGAPAVAQTPAPAARPVVLNDLPAPDAAGRCLLRGGSEATYALKRPVDCRGKYRAVLGPEGDPARITFNGKIPGFLASLALPATQPWQWQADGGVRLVKDPAGKGDGNALTLRDLDGDATWPGPAPNQWAGCKALAYTLDCSLATWESADGWPPIDLFGIYADQVPSPVGLIAIKGGLILYLVDSTGTHRTITGKFPGGPLAPGTRGVIGVLIDAIKGTVILTWNGATIGSGTFVGPLAENTDGKMMVGAQSPQVHHDPDMTLYAFAQVADGKASKLAIPPAPDWYFGAGFVLADRLGEYLDWAVPPTDFKHLTIDGGPSVGIAIGGMEARNEIDHVAVWGANVALEAGLGAATYSVEVNHLIAVYPAVAAVKSAGATVACRTVEAIYPGRHATLQRAGILRIDGLTLAPGNPTAALFRGLRSPGDRTTFKLADAVLDFEGAGPPAYLDFDAAGRDGPGATALVLEGVAFGTGTGLATLRCRTGQAAGTGTITFRDCTSEGQVSVPAAPGWTIAGTLNGQPAAAPTPPAPAPPNPDP